METLDYDHTLHTQNPDADKNLAVRFYMHPLKDEEKSLEAGRPIFKDTELVEIRVRGDRNSVVVHPVSDADKQRFPHQYRAFKEGQAEITQGTPLKEWPIASASMVEELKYLGFLTVENVAAASDSACDKVPGLRQLKKRAAAYIEIAAGNSPVEKLQAEIEFEKNARQAAEAQVTDLARRLEALEQAQTAPVATAKPAK